MLRGSCRWRPVPSAAPSGVADRGLHRAWTLLAIDARPAGTVRKRRIRPGPSWTAVCTRCSPTAYASTRSPGSPCSDPRRGAAPFAPGGLAGPRSIPRRSAPTILGTAIGASSRRAASSSIRVQPGLRTTSPPSPGEVTRPSRGWTPQLDSGTLRHGRGPDPGRSFRTPGVGARHASATAVRPGRLRRLARRAVPGSVLGLDPRERHPPAAPAARSNLAGVFVKETSIAHDWMKGLLSSERSSRRWASSSTAGSATTSWPGVSTSTAAA